MAIHFQLKKRLGPSLVARSLRLSLAPVQTTSVKSGLAPIISVLSRRLGPVILVSSFPSRPVPSSRLNLALRSRFASVVSAPSSRFHCLGRVVPELSSRSRRLGPVVSIPLFWSRPVRSARLGPVVSSRYCRLVSAPSVCLDPVVSPRSRPSPIVSGQRYRPRRRDQTGQRRRD